MSINPKFDARNVSIVSVCLHGDNRRGDDTTRRNTDGLVAACYRALVHWQMKRQSRRALREMTGDQLRDIGLSPDEAAREVSKSYFWD